MNDRIKELWSQAGGHYDSGNQHTWPQYKIDNPEKFAMLIIKRCRNIVSDNRDLAIEDGWKVDEAMSTAINDIKEHFGVKE